MAHFTLEEVVKAVQGKVEQQADRRQFTGVVTDTRRITPGCIFIALRGERYDGHDFAAQAVELGAACVIVSRPVDVDNAVVVWSSDTLAAYQKLAELHRLRFDIPLIAVTGSNGKTTTKDLTAAVLSQKFKTLKTEANFNNEIGLPLTMLQLEADHQVAVVEMGMRGLGQIAQMAAFAHPTIGIVTNVGETHMELLGSVENIARAKGELIDAVNGRLAVLNGDNHYVAAMRNQMKNGRTVLFGCNSEVDVQAFNIKTDGELTEFDCRIYDEIVHFSLPMAGRHNVYNALAAIAIGHELGLNAAEIQCGLDNVDMSAMRMTIIHKDSYTIINDAYNASPMSMQAALQALTDIAGKRRLAVLGDMLELGAASVEAHQNVGRWAAEAGIFAVIVLGSMAKYIAAAAKEGGVPKVVEASSHQEAAAALRGMLQAGDTILFKGSRGMQMEKVIELI